MQVGGVHHRSNHACSWLLIASTRKKTGRSLRSLLYVRRYHSGHENRLTPPCAVLMRRDYRIASGNKKETKKKKNKHHSCFPKKVLHICICIDIRTFVIYSFVGDCEVGFRSIRCYPMCL